MPVSPTQHICWTRVQTAICAEATNADDGVNYTERKRLASMPDSNIYTVWGKKVAFPKTFCDIFFCGEPVQLKIILVIAQTYSYVHAYFGPFI